jgi:hypothetical protein
VADPDPFIWICLKMSYRDWQSHPILIPSLVIVALRLMLTQSSTQRIY